MTALSRGDRVRLRNEIATYGTVLRILPSRRASVGFDDGRAVIVGESRLAKVEDAREPDRPATATPV